MRPSRVKAVFSAVSHFDTKRNDARRRKQDRVVRRARSATVLENSPVAVDDTLRQLTLAVQDPVDYIFGRRIPQKQCEPRWLDAFEVPGQKLKLECPGGLSTHLLTIASSPTEARIDSAQHLDVSIVKVVVEQLRNERIFHAAPQQELGVSDPCGVGFASPVNPDVTFTSILETRDPLLLIASGPQGVAGMRAALQWAPLQAAFSDRPVVVLYLAASRPSAAYVTAWDDWKAAGATFLPVYMHDSAEDEALLQPLPQGMGSMDSAQQGQMLPDYDRMILHLEPMFLPGGDVYQALRGNLKGAAVLFSGLSSLESKVLFRILDTTGVHRDRILL